MGPGREDALHFGLRQRPATDRIAGQPPGRRCGLIETHRRDPVMCTGSGMRVLLRAKCGDLADLDDLARRLTDRDHDGNIARIVAGATLAQLRS